MEDRPVLMPVRPASGDRLCHALAALLVLAAAAGHVAYLALACPLDLAPDEAHYWDWSRHLDWSYYSKGPLVAWLIRLSCSLFGPWSAALTGSEMLAVRLPAVVCGSLLLLSLYVLTVQVFGSDRLALGVVTLRHLLAHTNGMRQESSIHWLGPLVYVGGQGALLMVFWFVAWVAAMIAHRPWTEGDAGKRYLWWTSLPMFMVFFVFSFKTG